MSESVNWVEHSSLADMQAGLHGNSALFAVTDDNLSWIDEDLDVSLRSRIRLHRLGEAKCIVVKDLAPADIRALHRWSSSVLVCPEAVPIEGACRVAQAARETDFRTFVPPLTTPPVRRMLGNADVIDRLEFLLSDARRLSRLPGTINATVDDVAAPARPVCRIVIVLDLLQDFEILKPFIILAAAHDSPFDLRVCITERVVKSHVWGEIKPLLQALAVSWFACKSPTDVTAHLERTKSVLLMASESNAKGHAFCHQAARIAPPQTVRICLQHGLECIGLRHHRAHDQQFPYGVRFESDIVMTWCEVDDLPNLHPLERSKCVAVGVTKSLAELAHRTRELQWRADARPNNLKNDGMSDEEIRLLVAENLHSVRFKSPHRYQRFMQFIESANAAEQVNLSIRAHPAMQTLQKSHPGSFDFLEGPLSPDALGQFDALVSAPSTIILDAVLSGIAVAVWSDYAYSGDCLNYAGLEVVTDIDEVFTFTSRLSDKQKLSALAWAVNSTSSLNGIPAAWNQLIQFA
jgi:hypothetical protein